MKKRLIRNKKARFATVSAVLTAMVILVAVLANVVLKTLVERYELYSAMTPVQAFDVTEDCYTLLEDTFAECEAESGKRPEVQILFCNLEEEVSAKGSENYYLYHTAVALAERFDNVELKFHDIYVNPGPIKPYTVSYHPLTGEEIKTAVSSTNVIVISENYHRVYQWTDFYIFENEEATQPWAYSGEKKLTSALMHAVDDDPRIVCLLNNHGETAYDYELLTLLDDAGYTVVYIDLYKDPIPDTCDLIISYNPNTDLIVDDLSKTSEAAILDTFLEVDGHSFFVFLENGTPTLPNFEAYLRTWGVETAYAKNTTTGVSHRYMVQDTSASLTTDGYTVYGNATTGEGKKFLNPDNQYVVFGNATALTVTGEGFVDAHNGTYQSTGGNRTLYPLYYSSEKSLYWANGQVVDGGSAILMSLTEQNNGTGSSYVGVTSSVDFCTRTYLQSAVYDNGDVLFGMLDEIGGRTTPAGLTIKPFASYDISTITTAQMLRWTLALAITPAAVTLVVAVCILIKRRRA